MYTFYRLATPTSNREELLRRQRVSRLLLKHETILQDILDTLATFSQSENVFLSFWRQDNFIHASKNFYFTLPYLDALNTSKAALLAKSILNHQRQIGWIITDLIAAVILTSYGIIKATNITDVPEAIKTWAEHYNNPAGPFFSLFSSLTKKIPQIITKPAKKIFHNKYVGATLCISSGILSALNLKNQFIGYISSIKKQQYIHGNIIFSLMSEIKLHL